MAHIIALRICRALAWIHGFLHSSAVPVRSNPDGMVRHEVTQRGAAIIQHDVSISRTSSSNGTIAVLVNTADHTLWNLQYVLVPSLLHNVRFETPITIMFHGSRQSVQAAVEPLQGHGLLRPLNIVDVSDFFKPSQEEASMLSKGVDIRMPKFGMPYRKMCEFWSVHAYTLPVFAKYRYLWRLDTAAEITKPVISNLYDTMNHQDAVFGYLAVQNANPEACHGLQQATEAFYKSDPRFKVVSDEAQLFLSNFEKRKCPHWNANCQLMDLDYLRQSPVYGQYTGFLANILHGFVKYRWGEHLVQTLFVMSQVDPQRTLCMQRWVPGFIYQGQEPKCDARISEPALVEPNASTKARTSLSPNVDEHNHVVRPSVSREAPRHWFLPLLVAILCATAVGVAALHRQGFTLKDASLHWNGHKLTRSWDLSWPSLQILHRAFRNKTPDGQESTDLDLRPSTFLADQEFQRRTCCMDAALVKDLRASFGKRDAIQTICEKLLLQVPGEHAAVVVAPPMGSPTAIASRGQDRPHHMLWLLLDEIDVDSKQTTFLHVSVASEQKFTDLYKIALAKPMHSAALESVKENDGND